MYGKGQGVPQDYQEAAEWLRMAVEQGDRSAQVQTLGVMYAKGRGGLEDYDLAYMWTNLATVQGKEKAVKVRGILEKYMREIPPSKT